MAIFMSIRDKLHLHLPRRVLWYEREEVPVVTVGLTLLLFQTMVTVEVMLLIIMAVLHLLEYRTQRLLVSNQPNIHVVCAMDKEELLKIPIHRYTGKVIIKQSALNVEVTLCVPQVTHTLLVHSAMVRDILRQNKRVCHKVSPLQFLGTDYTDYTDYTDFLKRDDNRFTYISTINPCNPCNPCLIYILRSLWHTILYRFNPLPFLGFTIRDACRKHRLIHSISSSSLSRPQSLVSLPPPPWLSAKLVASLM